MSLRQSRIIQLKERMTTLLEALLNVPEDQRAKTYYAIEKCKECLASVPPIETPVYIHIIGTDKSFKTSYLLDLFDHSQLRELFSVKAHNTSENTAVPCLVEPSDLIKDIKIRQISISSGAVMQDNLSPEMFVSLYDLSKGAVPDDYLLQVMIPADQTPMRLSVIEYPGIKEGADASESQKTLHKIFQQNLIQNLIKFPGILVACFQHKVAIPPGHPIDIILKKYGEVLDTDNSWYNWQDATESNKVNRNQITDRTFNYVDEKVGKNRLPLIISLQGASAITGYCGNTNVEKDIATDFKSYKSFDTTIQLVNPYNHAYSVNFGQPGHYVDSWIKNLSRYKDVYEIHEQITLDGGISWSRALLDEICHTSHIQDALDNIFFRPWAVESQSCIEKSIEILREIETYDEVREITEKIRQAIINGKYRTIRTFFNSELATATDGVVENHSRFWSNIFYQYLLQFFNDNVRCNAIAKVLWQNLENRLDPEHKGFLGTREQDLPFIIMNTAELYVPNAVIRGDVDVFRNKVGEK
ncbi:MAG: hypothetical protein HQK68_02805 [Desulfamplus sp.]|nr:hypothetical protein [Desulfamplus sp.]